MATHPYANMPHYTRWARSVAGVAPAEVDPVVDFPFKIRASDKVATAGSCFAQHIARHLRKNGFNYFIAEDGHPIAEQDVRDAFNYGVFSARYGNIYTSRQLLQLFKRATGQFTPKADYWRAPRIKGFVDPFRPTIQPDGFSSIEELRADREQHLRRVRSMLVELDYFVFTLGLTEMWYDKADGAAFPICPGVSGGDYDESRVGFLNLGVDEVVRETREAFEILFALNPKARIILTVSPVPLAATAAGRHVMTSTTYSKAVLRVAAEQLCNAFGSVAYFPSYELITGQFNRGAYYGPDLREVTEEGVSHVMRLFLKHGTEMAAGAPPPPPPQQDTAAVAHMQQMAQIAKALCDEELLERAAAESERAVG